MNENQFIPSAGTSLVQVAFERYSDVTAWREIADANGLDIFNPLPVGQPLELPARSVSQVVTTLGTTVAQRLDLQNVLEGQKRVDWLL